MIDRQNPQPDLASSPLVEIEDLRIAFSISAGRERNWNQVVRGISLKLQAGKTLALVGESGSGKSVISQALMGILPANGRIEGGAIRFRDPLAQGAIVDIAQLDPDGRPMRDLRGGRIAMIFQEPMSSLAPVYTIGNQISEALRLHRPDEAKRARQFTEDMLDQVGFRNPHHDYDKYPFELSGGLRQRAMLAMAMICKPAVLIADEPTTALDVTVQRQILKLMRDLQRDNNMGLLLITHDLGLVANMADEVSVIYHGQIMESGSVEAIFRNPQHPYVKALLKATPDFDMAPGERLVSLREIKLDPQQFKSQPKPIVSGPLIEVRNLCKTYGQIKSRSWFGKSPPPPVIAVDNVSFDIAQGECLGLVGESGCGKTTLSKMLMHSVSANGGQFFFNDGKSRTEFLGLSGKALRLSRKHIQMIFQDPVSSLSPRMTVADIIREPLDVQNIGTPAERTAKVRNLLEAVGLDPRFLNRYPHSFSGGQRQRIGIARALALEPDIIICDEAVSALDVSVQAQVLNLLKDLQARLGLTYLFISHNLAVVGYVAHRIAVMARGRIVELAPRHQLFKNPIHPYTQKLLQSVPLPDLDRLLDLDKPLNNSPSDPTYWPEAFQPSNPEVVWTDVGDGHFVMGSPQCTRQGAWA